MKNYFRLLRPKHCIKNLIIFFPLIFGRELFNMHLFMNAVIGFFAFCFLAGSVYIINDIKDVEKDRKHPTKKNRPIAFGAVTVSSAKAEVIIALILAISCEAALIINGSSYYSALCLFVYFVLNILYSNGWKNIPILDIVILVSGFILRLIFGATITGIALSGWMYLTVLSVSFYLGLGKRRNEIMINEKNSTRGVLKHYNYSFLDKNMYLCLALSIVFYSMWANDTNNKVILFGSVPLIIVMALCYSLDIEGDSDGDPVEVIFRDKRLIVLAIIFAILIIFSIYEHL